MTLISSWIRLRFKMLLKNKAFICLLVLMPLIGLVFGLSDISNGNLDTQIVYLYAEEEDEFTKGVMDTLLGEHKGYEFKEASSQDEIEEKVSSHKALCGFVFSAGQLDRVKSGKTMRNVTFIERIGNVKSDIVSEMFFASYYKMYTRYYTPVYMGEEDSSSFYKNYDELMKSSIFDFSVEELEYEGQESKIHYGRNIMSILIFIHGLLLVSDFIGDKERGILYGVRPSNRIWFRLFYFAFPLVCLIPSLYIGIILEGIERNQLHELVLVIGYVLALLVFSLLVSFVIRKKTVIFGLIPALSLILIFICPTFVDLSLYVSAIRYLRLLCLPYYFMVL